MAMLDADFSLRAGQFELTARLALDGGVLVLFGPSGAGKSLTLAALAGLVKPRTGRIEFASRTVFDASQGIDVPTRDRRVGYVPQHHSLFPFRDVAENVAFGLPRRRRRRDDPLVLELLEELELDHLARERPSALSGGERQRAAFARALAVQPTVLLLDEPFASIDRAGRERVRAVLARTLSRRAIPAVLVTHSAVEALELGTQLVLFERGRTVAWGSPSELLSGDELVVEGAVASRSSDGAKVVLTEAHVTGPAELLGGGDRVRVRLPIGEE